MSNFSNDLKMGQKWEKECEKYFDNIQYPPPGKFSPYDFISNDVKYEVKADRMSFKSGNICIEIECSNKPSGIMTSEADYYIYFSIGPNDDYQMYKIPINILKESIKGKRTIMGGDFKRSKLVLIKLLEFKKYIIEKDNNIIKIINQDGSINFELDSP